MRRHEIGLALLGHGTASWERRRDARAGIRLGLLAVSFPGLIAAALYLAHGGSPVELAFALVVETVSLASAVIHEVGLVSAAVLLLCMIFLGRVL